MASTMVGPAKAVYPNKHLKHISLLIGCAILIAAAVVGLQILSNREEVSTATTNLVTQNVLGARDDLLTHLESLTRDYSYWDDAYEKAYLHPDSDWLRENFGSYLSDSFGVTGVFLVYADGRVLQILDGKLVIFTANTPILTTFVGSLRDLAARARNDFAQSGEPSAHSAFVRFDGKAAATAASLVVPTLPHPGLRASDLPAMAFVQPMTEQWLAVLAKRLSLQHISLHPVDQALQLSPLHPADILHPEIETPEAPGSLDHASIPPRDLVFVPLLDVQNVPFARLEFVPPNIIPSLSTPYFLTGVALSGVLLLISILLLRQTWLASQRTAEQSEILRLEVLQRENAERELLLHKDRLEATIEDRNRSLTREVNRTNALLHDLESALERVQRIVDTSNEGYIQIDMAGRVVGCNQCAQRILGYDARELLGQNAEKIIAPESHALFKEQIRLRSSTQFRTYVLDAMTKEGAVFPVEISSSNDYENGELKGSIGFFRDLRPERQQNKVLTETLQSLQDLQTGKATFISQMAHELRSRINTIMGYAQMILSTSDSVLPDRQKNQLRRIHQAGEVLLTMVNESVDLVRIEADLSPLSSEPVSANTIIDETVRLAAVLAEQMSVTLIADHYRPQERETQVMVRADAARLRQVLLNLVSNGIKYNRPGGEVRLSVRVTDSGRVRFTIQDTGIGIPQPLLPQVFSPFKRLGQERSQVQGSGLGLAVTHAVVSAMGGTITVNSAEGEGSTFTVDLQQSTISGNDVRG